MLKITFSLLLLLGIIVLFNLGNIKKLHHAITIFDKEKIIYNFLNMEKTFPYREIKKSEKPTILPSNLTYNLLKKFEFQGKSIDIQQYMAYSNTTGLLILHKDSIIYEQYFNGMEENTTHISWSVAKSFVSALVGIALEEGLFDSIEDPITKYLPQLEKSGYNGVRIKDILQMSSGIKFTEDYKDFNSDINRFGRNFALGKPLEKFILSLHREREPGNFNHYVSMDTQVLGMLVMKVTGKSLSAYLKEKIWNPLGMEYDAQWIIDKTGTEAAFGGLNIALRDYAKFGLLYLKEGNWKGKQIVPKDWIQQSITPDAPHLQPGADNPKSDNIFGYGFQWWLPEKPDKDYFASGIYNQYIYVNTQKELVIIKTSGNYHFKELDDNSKEKHIAMFQAMARAF